MAGRRRRNSREEAVENPTAARSAGRAADRAAGGAGERQPLAAPLPERTGMSSDDVRQRLVALRLRGVLGALLVLRSGQDGNVLDARRWRGRPTSDRTFALTGRPTQSLFSGALDQGRLGAHVALGHRVAERLAAPRCRWRRWCPRRSPMASAWGAAAADTPTTEAATAAAAIAFLSISLFLSLSWLRARTMCLPPNQPDVPGLVAVLHPIGFPDTPGRVLSDGPSE